MASITHCWSVHSIRITNFLQSFRGQKRKVEKIEQKKAFYQPVITQASSPCKRHQPGSVLKYILHTHKQELFFFQIHLAKSSQKSGANVNKYNFTASAKTKSSPVTMYFFFGTMKTWQREGSPWLRKPGLAFTLVGDAPRRISGKLNESIQSQGGGDAKEWVKVYYRQASGTIRISNHRPDLHGSHPSTPHRFN